MSSELPCPKCGGLPCKEGCMHEVGCRKCGNGSGWRIFTNGEFIEARHDCGHTIPLGKAPLTNKADPKPISMRFFT